MSISSYMTSRQLELTHEQTSPLFRLMWVYDVNEAQRRNFDNNICAFHIGNGFILTVAHNLRSESQIVKSIDNTLFNTTIIPQLNPELQNLFNQVYLLDSLTNKRYLNISNQADVQKLIIAFQSINFDTRWLTLTQKNFCKPYLIINFTNNLFYSDQGLTNTFDNSSYFHEPSINKYTFLLEAQLVEAFYSEDIALYRIINTSQEIINRLPSISPDYSILPDEHSNYYCLQSAPSGSLGRLLNKAQIEGYLDHYGTFIDRIGGNYSFEGLRYLIKGYFRFGSSGAPYLFYDDKSEQFKVNAIQSEASPIQLSINNQREGNFQYINAIATPLNIIESKLRSHLGQDIV